MAAMVKVKGSDELLKIGEVARRTGVTLRTIRYYQSLGPIAIRAVLKGGKRVTRDLRGTATTREMADAIIGQLTRT